MRAFCVPALASAVVLALICRIDVRAQQSTQASDAAAPGGTPILRLSGSWDYNDQDSVNAATGRPEQAPRSATQRGARGTAGRAGLPAAPAGGTGEARGGGPGFSGGNPSGFGGGRPGFSPLAAIETRSLTRDLLEVPEAFTIKVEDEAVTFVDDLERDLTYPTNGRKQKYQLGAAQFDARVRWTGPQLRKDIEGPFGFRMSETYFLSADGQRLFVIVRVGEQKPGGPVVGFNRVYDRVARVDDRDPSASR